MSETGNIRQLDCARAMDRVHRRLDGEPLDSPDARWLAKHLAEQEIGLQLTTAAEDQLAEEGYDPEYGARPLKRAIQQHVQNPLAEAVLAGRLEAGQTAVVDYKGGAFMVEARPTAAPEPVHA